MKYTDTPRGKWHKRYNWKRRGINVEEAQHLHDSIKECQICKSSDKMFHIDHDHRTMKIRGLLCSICNRGLGYFKDSPELLRKAANYLEIDKNGKVLYK